jgi:hypothetical protein
MLPIVGGNWNNNANAGVFTVNLNNDSGNSNNNVGCRGLRLKHIRPGLGFTDSRRAVFKGGNLSCGLWPQINRKGDSSRHCSTVSPFHPNAAQD